jgi:hypothetical protein
MDGELLISLIDNVNTNIFEYDIIEYTINIIKEYIYHIDNDFLINLLIKYIHNENFVINFLDKLLYEIEKLQPKFSEKLFSSDLSLDNIKNLLLLENITDKIYLNLYFSKQNNYSYLDELFEYIYIIGKLDNFIISIKKYINTIQLHLIENYLLTNLKYFINLFNKYKTDENTFLKLREFINYYITNIIYAYIDTKNILNYLLFENTNDKFIKKFKNTDTITYFIDFFIIENEYFDIYFDKTILINQILFLKYMNTFFKTDINNIINLLKPIINFNFNLVLLSNIKLNKHDRYDIFYDMGVILSSYESNYVPNNIVSIILDFLKIDFIQWIKIDDFIKICEILFKLLIKSEKSNNLFNLENKNYDDFLYNLIKIENEILNSFEIQIKKDLHFSNYSSIKIILYDYLNILNIITHFQIKIIDKLNNDVDFELYGDLIYMLNLQLNKYILLSESENITKYSLKLLFRNVIITKFVNLLNQIENNKYVHYGLEYEKIINYYNNMNFNISHNFVDVIQSIQNEEIILNENTDLEDNLFCVKIKNKYKLPSQQDFFERDMIRLLIREKEEDPFTRQHITLKELDEYNHNHNYN